VVLLAVGKELVVDEFTPGVGVNSWQGEGQLLAYAGECSDDTGLALAVNGHPLGPSGAQVNS